MPNLKALGDLADFHMTESGFHELDEELLSFVLTTKCRRIRAQQSTSALNFALDQLARVLRVAWRMRCRRYLQALLHQLIRHLLAHRLLTTLP